MTQGNETQSGAQRLMMLMAGKWVTASISAAAELGVADALSSPKSGELLAEELGCDPAMLGRLLKVLATQEIVLEDDRGCFSLTETGEALRHGELRDLALYLSAPVSWDPWPHLAESVRRGVSAFELAKGVPLFEYLEGNPEAAASYHRGVDSFTREQARAMNSAFDFSNCETVVDLGGGRGTLLLELLTRWPHLRGTLFDRDAALHAARSRPEFQDTEISARVRFQEGDFRVPLGLKADAIVIKHVLHNWDDEVARQILVNAAAALEPGGTLLVMDGVTLPGGYANTTRLLDIEMLALCEGGRERSKPQFRRLLSDAGLRLSRTVMLSGGALLLVAHPR